MLCIELQRRDKPGKYVASTFERDRELSYLVVCGCIVIGASQQLGLRIYGAREETHVGSQSSRACLDLDPAKRGSSENIEFYGVHPVRTPHCFPDDSEVGLTAV
jgi:hypothetical protein